MPRSYPFPDPPYPYALPHTMKIPHRPSLPSPSTSIFLTPIQEQRILSWRTHATPPVSPLTTSLAPTPALTHAASPTNGSGTASSRSARNPHSRLTGTGTEIQTPKVRSAPATLVTPSGSGSGVNQCKACGASCGCSVISRGAHPNVPTPLNIERSQPTRHRQIMPESHSTQTPQTSNSFRQRSYYSTKKYRQARALEIREQSGYGTETTSTPILDPWAGSKSRSALGKTSLPHLPNGAGGWEEDQVLVPGTGNVEKEQAQTYMQPEWDGPQNDEPTFAPAQPPLPPPPAPRIGGARDPLSQRYWRNMYPPVGGAQGIHSGVPRPMMSGGMPGMMLHY